MRLGNDVEVVGPFIVLSSRFERNLMQTLARDYKDDYDKTTRGLEDCMLYDLRKQISEIGMSVVVKHKLGRTLPDADLMIYDKTNCFLAFVECKWVIPPAESNEVFSRSDAEEKGRKQAQTLLKHAQPVCESVFKDAFPSEVYTADLEVAACVCMRGFVGMARYASESIPTIEEKLFLGHLSQYRDLKSTFDWMSRRAYLPVVGQDFDMRSSSQRIGPYQISWTNIFIPSAKSLSLDSPQHSP